MGRRGRSAVKGGRNMTQKRAIGGDGVAKRFLGAGALVALTSLTPSVQAEKVFLRDELTGAEVWRLTNCDAFHGYGNSFRPFSGDGQ